MVSVPPPTVMPVPWSVLTSVFLSATTLLALKISMPLPPPWVRILLSVSSTRAPCSTWTPVENQEVLWVDIVVPSALTSVPAPDASMPCAPVPAVSMLPPCSETCAPDAAWTPCE